ncbi:hypothetical protein CXB51_004700 [Gossypium anomalum]|uniref:DNA topoisomerase (ATP-hydrolyzing) n=1 Tax=Gossypium anomalum TaxID=47600 RepID=A0A8J5ZH68_9ROSI|nr:hypothetical protein CXB51_004700 [Gossypium anomalum]
MSLSATLRVSSFLRHNLFLAPSRASAFRRNEDDSGPGNGSLMAVVKDGTGDGRDGRVLPFELHKEAMDSYMAYALSVLLGRALPDVRDGLKPVHRRILYAMHELGLSSRKPFKKCARVVGEVLGKFHPHGDNAVYDSMVRMAQDFSLRFPLIQGHGNFGSIDADPPAAMRYTECRLEVDFVPNFDNSQKEPSLLPARLPTLLLNGSSGIAVGMATNIPPHNLGELVDVLCALIHNPEASLQELLEYMPGPDFPTGGLIMGNLGHWVAALVIDGISSYRTGRGRIVVRGKADIELLDSKTKRSAVIIKEIPYQTNKSSLVEKIAELVESKTLEGINDIRDESDRSGMRVVIELKRGADPSIVLNNLYRLTALQSSFNCNMVGILDGQPKLMGLKELLQNLDALLLRDVQGTSFHKHKDRRHIVEGIVVGLDNLDRVIDIIKEAKGNAAASAGLKEEFNLSDKQAEAVLDISLRRLNLLERKKFVDESASLMEQISKLTELLSSRKNILQLIEQEALELKNKFSSPRRSILDDSDGGLLEDIDVIPNEEMLLWHLAKKFAVHMTMCCISGERNCRASLIKRFNTNYHAKIKSLAWSRYGHSHTILGCSWFSLSKAYPGLWESSRTAAGTPLIQIISLSEGERITSIVPVSEFAEDQFLVMLTVNGYIKESILNYFSAIRSTGIIAIQLVPGDELKWVRCCTHDDLVAMASQNGMVILSSCDIIICILHPDYDVGVAIFNGYILVLVRGAIAMRLKGGDKMASMDIIPAPRHTDLDKAAEDSISYDKGGSGPWLLFVSENGYGKRVPLSSFKQSPLNRVGLIGYKFSSEDRLVAVFVVGFSLTEDGESDEQVVLVSQSGTVNRIKVRDISIQSRYARGVIMRLEHAGKIQSASLISASAEEAAGLLPGMQSEEATTNAGTAEGISMAS